ncbi:hypothetical protein ASPWEDRAFT_602961 [Aspergillus wentii DTO 134E9]|uniref:Uncharacterized protein n=1 Tax=Aspergillus wentii DTO 134E9 TaxID=1073089 RepID=A0A1L9RDN7_ASPWE|nr:uncharacterized protein ASPWEDRAFT_602961 [Aspergillus wentii DTO 134E9]OJJ33036.1 hypothetical protein ASPWEDRAFT_602961 [Aspergillus wentii DTO 134E9]
MWFLTSHVLYCLLYPVSSTCCVAQLDLFQSSYYVIYDIIIILLLSVLLFKIYKTRGTERNGKE